LEKIESPRKIEEWEWGVGGGKRTICIFGGSEFARMLSGAFLSKIHF